MTRYHKKLNFAAIYKGMRNGQLIDILQLVAKAYASRNGCNLDIGEGLEAAHKVEECCLTLNRCGYGNNNLLNSSCEQLIA